jgi:hypothetical protein
MLPGVASLASYGAALNDYSSPKDATTDRSAAAVNPAFGDVAAMTHTAPRAWVRFKLNGSSAPTLPVSNAHDEMWNNGNNAAPVPARTNTGIYTVTFPGTVFDEIPLGAPGANPSGYPVNLRTSWGNLELGSTTNYDVKTTVTSANVITVKIFTIGTSTLVDPNDGTIVGVFGA